MVGRVLLPRQQLEDVMVVPRRAIERDEDGYRLYVVANPDGDTPRVESRLVTLGPTAQGRTAILDGLEPGAAVIVTGQNNAAEGDRANIVERYTTLDDEMIDPESTQRPVSTSR
jgi:multidrug efflux pump subunit AcrA (membrane-fusion protein)